MKNDRILTLTDATWEHEVLASAIPVVVDFWAAWCAPCRVMAPTVDELARELDGRAKVGTLDVDANQATSDRYGIRGIPTVILIKNAEVQEKVVGVTTGEMLSRLFAKHLDS